MDYQKFFNDFMAANARGDRAALEAMVHPDFSLEEAAGLPYAGVYKGVDGMFALMRSLDETWSKFRLKVIEFPCQGENSMVVRIAVSGTLRKTGNAFATTAMELWRFKDGRLFEIVPYYFDTHMLAKANGA